ncbi:Cytochrome c oxidase subunit 6A1, mitochondrial [Coemansia sp. IMI 209128]|nr:Cytochrome c oxidase subunit 6A1, mitochondrial [Coemansia sp. IMI 209128]
MFRISQLARTTASRGARSYSASVETWRKISLFVAVPSVVIFSYVATKEELDHIHHLEHDPPKFVAYPYLRIRRRKLPYGDGDHTPFSNPLVNPDPEE